MVCLLVRCAAALSSMLQFWMSVDIFVFIIMSIDGKTHHISKHTQLGQNVMLPECYRLECANISPVCPLINALSGSARPIWTTLT